MTSVNSVVSRTRPVRKPVGFPVDCHYSEVPQAGVS